MAWDDDSKEQRCRNMVCFICNGQVFKKVLLVGCLTENDFIRMRNKKKHKEKCSKEKKGKRYLS